MDQQSCLRQADEICHNLNAIVATVFNFANRFYHEKRFTYHEYNFIYNNCYSQILHCLPAIGIESTVADENLLHFLREIYRETELLKHTIVDVKTPAEVNELLAALQRVVDDLVCFTSCPSQDSYLVVYASLTRMKGMFLNKSAKDLSL